MADANVLLISEPAGDLLRAPGEREQSFNLDSQCGAETNTGRRPLTSHGQHLNLLRPIAVPSVVACKLPADRGFIPTQYRRHLALVVPHSLKNVNPISFLFGEISFLFGEVPLP